MARSRGADCFGFGQMKIDLQGLGPDWSVMYVKLHFFEDRSMGDTAEASFHSLLGVTVCPMQSLLDYYSMQPT